MKPRIEIYSSKAKLVTAAADMVVAAIAAAVAENGRCAIALSGGSTPREVYRTLATEPWISRVNWQAVHFFWGDERCVPPVHVDSNYRMAYESLLANVPVPPANIHRMAGEIAPEQAAEQYAEQVRAFFGKNAVRFDLVLLGIGEDGHTASLFPGTEVVAETAKIVAAVYAPKLDKWRVTLTLPVINAARQVTFLVAGKTKSRIAAEVLVLDKPEPKWPASMVQPREGELHWLLDAEAAELIEPAGAGARD